VDAVGYGCSGSKKEVRECLKAVISERDATIDETTKELDKFKGKLESCRQNESEHMERLSELSDKIQKMKDWEMTVMHFEEMCKQPEHGDKDYCGREFF
jgi:uncharacterized protein YhaN